MTSTLSPVDVGRPWIATSWMVVTGLLFVCVTGIVRYIGSDVPAAQAAFIRYIIGLFIMLPFMGEILKGRFGRGDVVLYSIRGLCHALGVILWFYAMARIPIAEVTAIGYLSPIYIAVGAAVFLGEKLATRRILAIVAAFIGAMVILRPGIEAINEGQTAMLITAPLFAVSYLLAKRLSMHANPAVVVGMLSFFVTIGIAPFAYAVWTPPSSSDVIWLFLVAIFATAGHFTMTKALSAAPLAVTQPVTFLQLVWASFLGYVVFNEKIDFWVLMGGGIIIASVSFISYREWVLSRVVKTPPAVAMKT